MDAEQPGPDRRWPPPPVALHQFDMVAVNATVDREGPLEIWPIQVALDRLFTEAVASRSRSADGFHVLAGIASMVMSPRDPGRVWGPRQTGARFRSPAPEDLRGEQNAALAGIAASIANPALKAHVADLAWTNDRKLRASADLAVGAYCECAEQMIGVPPGDSGSPVLAGVGHVLARALQIANQTRKRDQRPERLSKAFELAYVEARDRKEPGHFVRFAELALHYGISRSRTVAADAETSASGAVCDRYPLAAAKALDLAAALFEAVGDQPSKLRCQLASVERRLEMRSHVSGPGAEAHWVQEALQSLKGVKGAEERRRLLRRELRDLQDDSLCELARFEYPLDLEEQVERAERAFAGLDLAAGLRRLLEVAPLPSHEDLTRRALTSFEEGGFSTLIGIGHTDDQGRTAAHTRAPGVEGPDENWVKTAIDRHEVFRRQILVQGTLEPARHHLCAGSDIREEHLEVVVSWSPFVPGTQAGLVSLGLLRMLQGDFRSATHLLVTQLEPCLRHLLRTAGHDPGLEFDDLTEQDVGC